MIIDTDEVDTYSINEIDERVIQARLEAEILEATTQELLLQEYPSDCCPETYYLRFPCLVGDPDSPFWQGWGNLRIKTFRLIENKYFETAVIAMILISSLALVRKYNNKQIICSILSRISVTKFQTKKQPLGAWGYIRKVKIEPKNITKYQTFNLINSSWIFRY